MCALERTKKGQPGWAVLIGVSAGCCSRLRSTMRSAESRYGTRPGGRLHIGWAWSWSLAPTLSSFSDQEPRIYGSLKDAVSRSKTCNHARSWHIPARSSGELWFEHAQLAIMPAIQHAHPVCVRVEEDEEGVTQ